MASRRVLIVGAGFAGLALTRALEAAIVRSGRDSVRATLLATGPCAQLSPLVPGLVSGWAEPWQTLVPLRPSLRRIAWLPVRAAAFDPVSHRVLVDGPGVRNHAEPASLPYDDLVFAVGAAPSLHAVDGAAVHALPLASVHHALGLRSRLADALAAASAEPSPRRRRALLTVAIVGSGTHACAAALECAAFLRDARHLHPRVRPDEPRVLLVSPGDHACPDFPPADSAAIARILDQVGIEVLTRKTPALVADRHIVVVAPGGATERLDVRTVVWAHHGAAVPLLAGRSEWMDASGRLRVDQMLRVAGTADVFALGSCAAAPTPQVSPARIAAAATVLARNLVARALGRPLETVLGPPRFDAVALDRDWGLATVGSRRVAGQVAACFARSIVLGVAPRWSHRQAVRAAWALRRLGSTGHMPAPDSSPPTLALTAPPPVVAQPADPLRFPTPQP